MRFSNDNVAWSELIPYTLTKPWTLSAGDGTKTVQVKFRDLAGNESGAFFDTITLDATPPSITVGLAGGTYVGLQTVSLTASEPGATIYYTTDGMEPTTASTVYSQAIVLNPAGRLWS
jgi:hypothetical protein